MSPTSKAIATARIASPAAEMSRACLKLVVAWWAILIATAIVAGSTLGARWGGWPWAFAAAATWGANLLVLVYGVGGPMRLSRPPILATGFAFIMTVLGTGSYWATLQLYPLYRVPIERAAWFVAICTLVALVSNVLTNRVLSRPIRTDRAPLSWDWSRLEALMWLVFSVAVVGTLISIRRIGYIPLVTGDPTVARIEYPSIGGVWYRLSMLGGVTALLAAVFAAARRASLRHYLVGIASLILVGLYGPRFFVVLPLGVAFLMWDRLRNPIRMSRALVLVAVAAPLLAFAGYVRERNENVKLLGPVAVSLYGTLGEFRDLGWALDYYGFGDRFLHGRTLGSVVVPLLPAPVWRVVGVDKGSIYAQDGARLLAEAMGQTAGQRIGAYGELYMNFGWLGALAGALLYGVLLAYLDYRFATVSSAHLNAVLIALTIAATVFAQIGQLNMFTSTLTGLGYPILLVALIAARRPVVVQ